MPSSIYKKKPHKEYFKNKKRLKKNREREKGRSINCEDKEWSADNKLANIKKREKKEKTRFANNHMKNQMRVQMRRR